MSLWSAVIVVSFMAICIALPQNSEVANDATQPDFITKKITELVEKLKGQMKEGIPEHNIPPLDPFRIEKVSMGPITVGPIKLKVAKFDNVQVNGLPIFEVENLTASVFALQLDLTLHLPLLSADGYYEVDGAVANILPVFGKGHFQVYTRNIRVGGKAKLSVKDRRISLKTLDLHSSIERIDTDIKGLLGGGDLGDQMNKLVENGAIQLVEKLKPKLHSIVSEFVRLRLNDGLKDLDIGNIVG